jgi:hypothetical protein
VVNLEPGAEKQATKCIRLSGSHDSTCLIVQGTEWTGVWRQQRFRTRNGPPATKAFPPHSTQSTPAARTQNSQKCPTQGTSAEEPRLGLWPGSGVVARNRSSLELVENPNLRSQQRRRQRRAVEKRSQQRFPHQASNRNLHAVANPPLPRAAAW